MKKYLVIAAASSFLFIGCSKEDTTQALQAGSATSATPIVKATPVNEQVYPVPVDEVASDDGLTAPKK